MGLTLGHGAWQIDQPSNGSMWNSYSFQSVGQWMGYSFTDLGAEGCCRSLNALLSLLLAAAVASHQCVCMCLLYKMACNKGRTAWTRQTKKLHTNKNTRWRPGLCNKARAGVLVLTVLIEWISGTCTQLVLVSSKVIVLVLVLVDKHSGTCTSTGTSTDILWYICDVRCKSENHHTCEINSLTYPKEKVPNWFILLWFEYMINGMWFQIP